MAARRCCGRRSPGFESALRERLAELLSKIAGFGYLGVRARVDEDNWFCPCYGNYEIVLAHYFGEFATRKPHCFGPQININAFSIDLEIPDVVRRVTSGTDLEV